MAPEFNNQNNSDVLRDLAERASAEKDFVKRKELSQEFDSLLAQKESAKDNTPL